MASGPIGGPVAPDSGLTRELRDALTHLYDHAYLERHPLAARLAQRSPGAPRTRGQETRRILLDAIELLNPGDNVGLRALERRAYAVLFGLYVEGQEVATVAEQLGISGRQLRRDRAAALEALAAIIEDRYLSTTGGMTPDTSSPHADSLHQESRRLAEQAESIVLVELVANLHPILAPLALERGVILQTDLSSTLPAVYANPTLLRQILLSLAGQAMAHVPPATFKTLTFVSKVSAAACAIGIRLEPASRAATSLLPPESLIPDREAIDTLAAALGGRVRIESAPSGESYLWLRLPQRADATVLVIDDNQDLLELFRRYLAGRPYQVVGAAGVDEGLAQARRSPPDVVVLDLMMPGRDGWEFLRTLREEPALRHLPVIVCSVLHEPELAYALGAQRVLKKPVHAADLAAALESVLPAVWAGAAHPATPASNATPRTAATPPSARE